MTMARQVSRHSAADGKQTPLTDILIFFLSHQSFMERNRRETCPAAETFQYDVKNEAKRIPVAKPDFNHKTATRTLCSQNVDHNKSTIRTLLLGNMDNNKSTTPTLLGQTQRPLNHCVASPKITNTAWTGTDQETTSIWYGCTQRPL